jgi:hypothetical protein
MFGHLFNDRREEGETKLQFVLKQISNDSPAIEKASISTSATTRHCTGSKKGSSILQKTNNPEKQGKVALKVRKDEYD